MSLWADVEAHPKTLDMEKEQDRSSEQSVGKLLGGEKKSHDIHQPYFRNRINRLKEKKILASLAL